MLIESHFDTSERQSPVNESTHAAPKPSELPSRPASNGTSYHEVHGSAGHDRPDTKVSNSTHDNELKAAEWVEKIKDLTQGFIADAVKIGEVHGVESYGIGGAVKFLDNLGTISKISNVVRARSNPQSLFVASSSILVSFVAEKMIGKLTGRAIGARAGQTIGAFAGTVSGLIYENVLAEPANELANFFIDKAIDMRFDNPQWETYGGIPVDNLPPHLHDFFENRY